MCVCVCVCACVCQFGPLCIGICVRALRFLCSHNSLQHECVVTNGQWKRQTGCLSAHRKRRMLRRLAILVMQQNLFLVYNIFAPKKKKKKRDIACSAAKHLHWHASTIPLSSPWGYINGAVQIGMKVQIRTPCLFFTELTHIHARPAPLHNCTHAQHKH